MQVQIAFKALAFFVAFMAVLSLAVYLSRK